MEKNSLFKSANQLIASIDAFEFQVIGMDRLNLIIAGSSDFIYYHKIEFRFANPLFFSGPMSWSVNPENNPLSPLTKKEINNLQKDFRIESPLVTIKFTTTDETEVLIGAESLAIDNCVVYYYERDNLKENEKIAEWVKRSNF